ncbi:MAG TPA: VCBS repeat-containing protein [Vicinamibacterales bacterium]|jgi:hypothetical protein|nr:VCBS repeat-containing protein [Vicinamibacterales bacterium]
MNGLHRACVAVAIGSLTVVAFSAQQPRMRFDTALLLEETSETSANVSFGDMNGDGRLDVMLAKGRHWPLVDQLLLNDGNRKFHAVPLGAADRTYAGLLVDLDGDRDLDVVISNDDPDPKRVYLNDGRGHFTPGSIFGKSGWPTRNIAVADLNGDARPDIVVANRTGDDKGFNYVCLNRGAGKFDSNCLPVTRESTTTITPADFDRDGRVDLAVPHREGGQSYVYFNDGQANFPRRVPFGPATAAIRISAAADFNGDGRLDLAVVDERSGPAVYLQQGDGTFGGRQPLERTATPYALAVADVDRDGQVDVIVGNVESRSVVYFNEDGRRFHPATFGDNKGTAYGIAVGDVDKDGAMDIAVARSEAPNVLYFGSR